MDEERLIQSMSTLASYHVENDTEEARDAYASYKPSFMEIKIPFGFKGDLNVLSDKELGTLLHEYVHYLQNLSTPWGLYSSMAEYNEMVNVYRAIQESDNEVVIPVEPYSAVHFDKHKKLLEWGNGYSPFGENRTFIIDRRQKIKLSRRLEDVEGKEIPVIGCKVRLDDGTEMNVLLGASIIKESMAAMIQKMIDPTATHERDDIPYNFVRILCEDNFEEVAKDPVKMITVCYMSLFSLSPGEVLINELDNANRNINLSAKELLDSFMGNGTVTMNGQTFPVFVFYGMLKDKFLDILEKTLTIEPTYIKEALDRADVSKGYIPVLSILYDTGITRERVRILMEGVGFPWVWTSEGIVNAKLEGDGATGSPDVNLLVCHNAMFSFLRYPNKWRCCPLRYLCLKGEIEEHECLDIKPWEGMTCVMSEMAQWLGLDKKAIRYA